MMARARCTNPPAERQEIRATNLCLKRRPTVSAPGREEEEARRIKQCVNGPAGWTRWGPADAFPHHVGFDRLGCSVPHKKKKNALTCCTAWPPRLAPIVIASTDTISMQMRAGPLRPWVLMGWNKPPASRCINIMHAGYYVAWYLAWMWKVVVLCIFEQ